MLRTKNINKQINFLKKYHTHIVELSSPGTFAYDGKWCEYQPCFDDINDISLKNVFRWCYEFRVNNESMLREYLNIFDMNLDDIMNYRIKYAIHMDTLSIRALNNINNSNFMLYSSGDDIKSKINPSCEVGIILWIKRQSYSSWVSDEISQLCTYLYFS